MDTTALFSVILLAFLNLVICRDFYVGMFKNNDLLVAQDRLYKEMVPYKKMYAKYGRIFECKITYFRVVDRLGYGPGPKVEIVRGGLRHKYVVLRLTSPYNMPISVNIYVGCPNTFKPTRSEVKTTSSDVTTDSSKADDKPAETVVTDEVKSDGTTAVVEETTMAPAPKK